MSKLSIRAKIAVAFSRVMLAACRLGGLAANRLFARNDTAAGETGSQASQGLSATSKQAETRHAQVANTIVRLRAA
ncbi:MAG: hypothetical protein HYR63_19300 [Proteobacteria bacterium]|nr:hypothetical protein [Pseudomonadota bacterium]